MRKAASALVRLTGPSRSESARTVPSSFGHCGEDPGLSRASRLESRVPGLRAPRIAACKAAVSREPKLTVKFAAQGSVEGHSAGKFSVPVPLTGPYANETGSQRPPESSKRNTAFGRSTALVRKSGFQLAPWRLIVRSEERRVGK